MKRLFTAILLLIYFTVSTGFAVSMHYCMNRLDSAVIGAVENEECGKCGMHTKDSNGCCRDEIKIVRLEIDQLIAKLLHHSVSLPVLNETQTAFLFSSLDNFPVSSGFIHPPPSLPDESDTWLQNRVFRL